MAATVEVACLRCKKPFTARVADRNRGWGRFCSKRCKAIKQEARTGQNAAFHARRERASEGDDVDDVDISDMEWGASDGDSGPVMQ